MTDVTPGETAHSYQRFITADEFVGYFERAGGVKLERSAPGLVRTRKQ